MPKPFNKKDFEAYLRKEEEAPIEEESLLPETQPRSGMPSGIPELISSNQRLAQALRPAERNIPTLGEAGDYFAETAANVPGSAQQLAVDTVTPLLSPKETAKTMGELAQSVVGKLGIGDASPEMANAVGQYFGDRYGGFEEAKNTFQDDPAGFLADAAGVLMLGSGVPRILGKAASIAGKSKGVPRLQTFGEKATSVADVTGRLADVVDPLQMGVRTAKTGVRGATKPFRSRPLPTIGEAIGGIAAKATSPLTGGAAVVPRVAYQAGREGGQAQLDFYNQMRDRAGVDLTEPVTKAQEVFTELKNLRSEEYTRGMKNLSTGRLDRAKMADIQKRVTQNFEDNFVKKDADGNVIIKEGKKATVYDTNPEMAANVQTIQNLMDDFVKDPRQHTLKNLDMLKQQINYLYKPGAEGVPVLAARDIVRDAIVKIDPQYAKIMSGYEDATALLDELVNSIGAGKRGEFKQANADKVLRKLQSTMRDNANTTWGARLDAVKKLSPEILPALAGQASRPLLPKSSLQRIMSAGAIGSVTYLDQLALGALVATASSPRIVGELAGFLGITARKAAELRKLGAPSVEALGRGAMAARERPIEMPAPQIPEEELIRMKEHLGN